MEQAAEVPFAGDGQKEKRAESSRQSGVDPDAYNLLEAKCKGPAKQPKPSRHHFDCAELIYRLLYPDELTA